MSDERNNWSAILWTSLIVSVTTVIIWNLFDRVIFYQSIHKGGQSFFSAIQPGYFPLVYLIATFIAVFIIVWVYSLMQSFLPQNWIMRGLVIGAALFLIIDMPSMLLTAFTTILPVPAARNMLIGALVTKVVNGCILTYTYRRFTLDAES